MVTFFMCAKYVCEKVKSQNKNRVGIPLKNGQMGIIVQ